jgi:hypothetical protein
MQETPAPAGLAVEPLLVPADVAGRMCGVSEATWWRLHAAAKVPAPVKVSHRTLWRVEDLRLWISVGCTDRRTFEAIQAGRRKERQ